MRKEYWTLYLTDKNLYYKAAKELGLHDNYSYDLYRTHCRDCDYIFIGYNESGFNITNGFGFMRMDDTIEDTFKSKYYERNGYIFKGIYTEYINDINKYNL